MRLGLAFVHELKMTRNRVLLNRVLLSCAWVAWALALALLAVRYLTNLELPFSDKWILILNGLACLIALLVWGKR